MYRHVSRDAKNYAIYHTLLHPCPARVRVHPVCEWRAICTSSAEASPVVLSFQALRPVHLIAAPAVAINPQLRLRLSDLTLDVGGATHDRPIAASFTRT